MNLHFWLICWFFTLVNLPIWTPSTVDSLLLPPLQLEVDNNTCALFATVVLDDVTEIFPLKGELCVTLELGLWEADETICKLWACGMVWCRMIWGCCLVVCCTLFPILPTTLDFLLLAYWSPWCKVLLEVVDNDGSDTSEFDLVDRSVAWAKSWWQLISAAVAVTKPVWLVTAEADVTSIAVSKAAVRWEIPPVDVCASSTCRDVVEFDKIAYVAEGWGCPFELALALTSYWRLNRLLEPNVTRIYKHRRPPNSLKYIVLLRRERTFFVSFPSEFFILLPLPTPGVLLAFTVTGTPKEGFGW